MQQFSIAPQEMLASIWRNRGLISVLIKRDVVGRYRGSFFGILWSFFNPLFMLGVYTFVFSVVFKARWAGGTDSKTEFALLLFAGLIFFNLFAECVSRAPSLILSNANYVKKVVFPLEILPWTALGSALFHGLVSLTVWMLAYVILFGLPHPTIVLLPIVVLPLIMFTMGITWFLASLGVYLRDVSQVVAIAVTILLFLSPIFYPVSSLPKQYQGLFMLNPLSPVIEQMRDILFWGRGIDWAFFLIYLAGSMSVAWLGFAWFQKTRRGFADVI